MGRNSAILNLLFPAFPFALGLVVAIALTSTNTERLALALGLCSASLLVLTGLKIPRWREGKLFGFGPTQAPPGFRWLWWFAFGLFCCGLIFTITALASRGT